jgi:hypothetical protein
MSRLDDLGRLRARLQRSLDTAEWLAQGFSGEGTPSGRELAALLECLVADRLAPAVQDLTAIEEAALERGGRSSPHAENLPEALLGSLDRLIELEKGFLQTAEGLRGLLRARGLEGGDA